MGWKNGILPKTILADDGVKRGRDEPEGQWSAELNSDTYLEEHALLGGGG